MVSVHSSASPKLDRRESLDSAGDMLKRGAAPADGGMKEPDFPLAGGIARSMRIPLGLKDRLIFWLLVGVLHALSLLPDFILYKLGEAGGLIAYRFDRRHTRIGIRNLEIAFPELSDAERRRILRASYMNLGRTGAEYVRLGGFFYRSLARRVTYNRLDIWNNLTPRYPGKGALILTAHFGNFELLPAGHALHGFQITVVHHTQRFLAGDALVTFIRERVGSAGPSASTPRRARCCARSSAARSSASRSIRTPSAPRLSGCRFSAKWPPLRVASIASR